MTFVMIIFLQGAKMDILRIDQQPRLHNHYHAWLRAGLTYNPWRLAPNACLEYVEECMLEHEILRFNTTNKAARWTKGSNMHQRMR
jgi:hypothetical protein